MPITIEKAPRTLPEAAKRLWVDTFNGALDSCEGTTSEKDSCAARIAWGNVKKVYRKVKDTWVKKSEAYHSYHSVLLTVTKASLQPDGSVRWCAVASDTGHDKANERTSGELFQDWIDRVTYKTDTGFLPEPRMPFLGVSHYPALNGFGEAGVTRRMYIDGAAFKADGIFNVGGSIGRDLLAGIKSELIMIKKGEPPEKPIRISAGWWDLAHYHEDSNYLFERKALTDTCPICEKGQKSDKIYRAGQLDHFAATRVPMNERTRIELEEKSMANKTTRKQDAESILGPEAAEELERRARLTTKTDTDDGPDLHPAMVIRADTLAGMMKEARKKKRFSLADLAAKVDLEEDDLAAIEKGADKKPKRKIIEGIAGALGIEPDAMLALIPRDEPRDKDEPEPTKAETVPEFEQVNEAGYDDKEKIAFRPPLRFGGATTIDAAEKHIETGQKMAKLHSHWDIFQAVVNNILMANEETVPDKVKALSNAVFSLGDRIDTLKAGLSDAFLIQESAAAYSEAEEIETTPLQTYDEVTTMSEDYQEYYEDEADDYHPAYQLKDAVDNALAGGDRAAQEAAIQKAFNEFAAEVQGRIEDANPVPVADQIGQAVKGALAEVVGPLAQQVAVLTAKMDKGQPAQAATPGTVQSVFVPEQKSVTMQPTTTPQPVQADGSNGPPISPVLGKPSNLTALIRKSVGLDQ